jgi:gas vesicle protein
MADRDEFGAFLVGFLVGALGGAVVALLFAPQSGEETRALIGERSIELRDKAVETSKQAYEQASKYAEETVESAKKSVSRKKPADDAEAT